MHLIYKVAVLDDKKKLLLEALSILREYFQYCDETVVVPKCEKFVVLGLLLKGFPAEQRIKGWWNEVSDILEEVSENLKESLKINVMERSSRYASKESLLLTLREPLAGSLDRKPFEIIFTEIAKVIQERGTVPFAIGSDQLN